MTTTFWAAFPRYAFDAAALVTLAAILLRGHWRRFPLFALSLVAIVAFDLGYRPRQMPWMQRWYAVLVTPVMGFRTAAALEAFLQHTVPLPGRKMLFCGFLGCAVMCAGGFYWLFVPTGSAMLDVIQIRRFLNITLAGFLGAEAFWFRDEDSCAFRNVRIQTFLALALATSSILRLIWPTGIWDIADPAFYLANAGLYLVWARYVKEPANAAPTRPPLAAAAAA